MADSSLEILIKAVDNASGTLERIRGNVEGLEQTSNTLSNVGQGIMDVGRTIDSAISGPARQAIAASVDSAISFESAMADVNKVLADAPPDFDQQLLAMARRTPIAAEGLAQIAANGAQLGIGSNEITDFTEIVGQMATAFDMSADQAGASVAKMRTVLGLDSMAEIREVGDMFNHLSDNSGASAAAMVDVATRVGGVSRNFGLANNEIAALSASFIELAPSPEIAATAINSILPALQNASGQTPRFQEALERVGFSAQEMGQMVQQDAMGAFQEFMGALGEMDTAARTAAISDMFGAGSDASLIASLAGETDLLARNLQTVGEAADYAGSMQREFGNRSATTEAQIQMVQNQIREIGIVAGQALLPAIQAVLGAISPLVTGIADFAAQHPKVTLLALGFLAIVGAIGPVVIGIGAVVASMGALVMFAPLIGSVVGAIAGIGAAVLGIGFAPILGAIAAIAAGAWLIRENWGTISAFFSNLWSTVSESIGSFATGLMEGLQPAMPAIESLKQSFSSIWQSITQASGAVLQLIGAIGGIALKVIEMTPLGQLIQQVGSAFSQAGGGAASFGQRVGAALGVAIQGIARVASSAASLVSQFAQVATAIISRIQSVAQQGFAAGQQIVQRIAAGIRAGIGAVTGAISSVASAIARALPGSPVKEGVLTILNNTASNPGAKIVEMIGAGMQTVNLANYLQGAMAPVASNAVPKINIPTASSRPPSVTSSPIPAIGGGNVSLTYAPTINIGGNTNPESFRALLEQHRDEIEQMLRAIANDQARVSYG